MVEINEMFQRRPLTEHSRTSRTDAIDVLVHLSLVMHGAPARRDEQGSKESHNCLEFVVVYIFSLRRYAADQETQGIMAKTSLIQICTYLQARQLLQDYLTTPSVRRLLPINDQYCVSGLPTALL